MKIGPFIVAAAYFYIENSYFSWNTWPKSREELICDGIGAILLALAWGGQRR